jgi:hypothetical protein
MRSSTIRLVVIAVGTVVATTAGTALVTSAGAIDAPTTLTFVNHPGNETGIDVDGNAELDPGDGWVSNSQPLVGDVMVGKLVSSCQYVKVGPKG